jgi:hypothetical protein
MGRLEQAVKNAGARPEYPNEPGMIFGANFTSSAVVPDGTEAPHGAKPITDYVPSARPGGRAHTWLECKGVRTSTIDLVGSGFVLLTPFGGKPWTEAAKYLATEYPLHLKTSMIDDGELMSAYHLDEAGAGLSGRLCRMAQPLEGEPSFADAAGGYGSDSRSDCLMRR